MGLISRVSSRTYRKSTDVDLNRKMPFHTAPGLASKNKFIFQDENSSEDEGLGNVDPSEMLTKATAKAVKQAKVDAKKQAAPVVAAPVQKEEPQKKKEPRANNQARKGPRRERGPKDGEAKDGENQVRERRNRDGDDRKQRRPRNQDRQSGNPRTGRKAQEKKGGAGAGNWGKADENLEEAAADQVEKTTPENAEGENAEAAAEENTEPAEPQIQYLTLEEYEAADSGDAVSDNKKEVRQSNDGQALKGRQLESKLLSRPTLEKATNNMFLTNSSDSNPIMEADETTEITDGTTDETITEVIEIITIDEVRVKPVVWPTLTTRMLFQLLAPSKLVRR